MVIFVSYLMFESKHTGPVKLQTLLFYTLFNFLRFTKSPAEKNARAKTNTIR